MFWSIFLSSLLLIAGILVTGWLIASLIGRHQKSADDS